jgi:hypothetical protein
MERLCSEHDLLNDDGGLIRIPFLVRGSLVLPPEVTLATVKDTFSAAGPGCNAVSLPGGQAVREPVIDRKTMKYTGEYVYQIMPAVTVPELVNDDPDAVARELLPLSADDILSYLETVLAFLVRNAPLALRVRELCRLTAPFPDAMLDGWFSSFPASFSREAGRRMIDTELSCWGRPGGDFLDGWVEIPAIPSPEWLRDYAGHNPDIAASGSPSNVKVYLRAMPTRQLHITAGNAPEVPLVSALRAILTRSPAVIKLPYGAVLPGALIAVAAASAAPDHPLTRHLSLVYWPGGDETIEGQLFASGAFDRVVVWGSPETVASVTSRSLYTRTVCLNPRYGVGLIGQEAFAGRLEEAVRNAALDVMAYNQKACTSSLVHYVEGTEEQADRYADALSEVLKHWETVMPNFVPPTDTGRIKRMRRGRYAAGRWHVHESEAGFASGVVVVPGEFDILEHPMCRLVVVRPVASLETALKYITPAVSAAGIFPEDRRLALRDRIASRGISGVLPLGSADRIFSGMPHDGMRVLNELVDWKTA